MNKCPECGDMRLVDAGELSQCEACGAVFEVAAPVPRRQYQLDTPSSAVLVSPFGDGVKLQLPWRQDVHPLYFLFVLLNGVFLVSTGFTSKVGTLVAPFVLLGFALLYWAACAMVNRTTLLIGPRGVDVSHGPLPSMHPTGTFSTDSFRTLAIGEDEYQMRHNTIIVYKLEVPGRRLLDKWNNRSTLAYVWRTIQIVTGEPKDVLVP